MVKPVVYPETETPSIEPNSHLNKTSGRNILRVISDVCVEVEKDRITLQRWRKTELRCGGGERQNYFVEVEKDRITLRMWRKTELCGRGGERQKYTVELEKDRTTLWRWRKTELSCSNKEGRVGLQLS
ncbi:hypothetical protein ElyMa_000539600 [Elysia marginata]|uniref:Uncharacterized protein n=1 Tax=Elysia marginata TaxID=1093978 RepID=A0AAV4FZP8_9GAST|nr:hypothetical protein ElyMa_000539600 [Elysia marginata]